MKVIFTSSIFEIEDQVDHLVQAVFNSVEMQKYLQNRKAMYQSATVQEKRIAFLIAKEKYEEVAAYKDYLPEAREKQRLVRNTKRKLDLDEVVASFRLSETQLQSTLDHLSVHIATAISEDIKVNAGNPFFEKGNQSSCGGSCHVN